MVTAGVPGRTIDKRIPLRGRRLGESRQRIEFGKDGDHRLAGPSAGHEGRGYVGEIGLDPKATLFEEFLQPPGAAVLQVSEFGKFPDVLGERYGRFALCLNVIQHLPLGRAAVERALELDETLAEAHAALGTVLTAELRFGEAEREFQRALELNHGSAEVHRQYSRLLSRVGRHEESVREARLALHLDPLSVRLRVSLVSRLFFARDFDGAIDEALKVLELEPDHVNALSFLGGAYTLNGQREEGIAALQRAIELDPDNLFRVTQLAWAYARSERREQALETLQEIDVEPGPILKEIAIVYGELGDLNRAFEYLDRAYAEDPGSLTYFRADPTADSLRQDPRFDELMKKLGLQ